jgi:hypothetical protein
VNLALRDHWADDVFEAPPLPIEDESPDDESPRHPLHRADGSPIGLRAYCELVTPSYRWDWAHLIYIDAILDRVTAGELKRVTIEGGGLRALGAGEGTAGLPAELLLIDDPIKNRKQANSKAFRNSLWEWITEDLFTRLEPNAAVVLTMTRRHSGAGWDVEAD